MWREHLVDELSVLIFPLVLGKGKRLFGNGAVKTGDFQLAEPSEAERERRRSPT
jgi:dihydrofolate reductase